MCQKKNTIGIGYCKVSAAGLIAASYPKAAPDAQTELRQMVGQLTKDETPMVR